MDQKIHTTLQNVPGMLHFLLGTPGMLYTFAKFRTETKKGRNRAASQIMFPAQDTCPALRTPFGGEGDRST
jgi:hypothetical protein